MSLNHSTISRLKEKICELIIKENVLEFWVGHYGDFDRAVTHCVSEIKKAIPSVKLYLIIPYTTRRIDSDANYYTSIYDGIIVATIPLHTPRKFMIVKCNQYMINNSEYLICFVKRDWGGAATTLKYEKSKKVKIINLAEPL